jgi:transposase
MGTKVPYGKYLQLGTKKMPMRKFLFIGPEAGRFGTDRTRGRLERWVGIIETDVSRRLKKKL